MAFGHFLHHFNDVRNVVDRRAAKELQRQMDVFGAAVIDEFLVCQVFLEPVDQVRIINGGRDMDGEEGSFGVHGVAILTAKVKVYVGSKRGNLAKKWRFP